jgi:hypothetical protein
VMTSSNVHWLRMTAAFKERRASWILVTIAS